MAQIFQNKITFLLPQPPHNLLKLYQITGEGINTMYIHDFGITVSQYSEKGQNNDFPVFFSCPMCKAQHSLVKHGFYKRYAVLRSGKSFILFIRRYFCPCCSHTLSVLPSFLHPHFQ